MLDIFDFFFSVILNFPVFFKYEFVVTDCTSLASLRGVERVKDTIGIKIQHQHGFITSTIGRILDMRCHKKVSFASVPESDLSSRHRHKRYDIIFMYIHTFCTDRTTSLADRRVSRFYFTLSQA
jgi:hypothetical protein